MKRRRFTLGELAIVLGIVALLLGVVFTAGPYNWKYYTSLHRSGGSCGASLKSLGSLSALYSGDHGGDYPGPLPSASQPWDATLAIQSGGVDAPRHWAAGDASDKTIGWFLCYTDEAGWTPGKRQFYLWPDNKSLFGVRIPYFYWGFFQFGEIKTPFHRSYAMNLGDGEFAATASRIPSSSLAVPARTVQLCEFNDQNSLLGQPALAGQTKDEFITKIFDAKTAPYHGKSGEPRPLALFYDGHYECTSDAAVRVDGGKIFKYAK